MDPQKPVEILLIEDNPGDARLTIEALRESHLVNNVHVASDGVEALAYLHRQPPYSNARRPDLILLDLNMPKKDGREVLDEIKQDQALKTIPVVVLTTSDNEDDVERSYERHANAFITKPVDLDRFLAVVSGINQFWLSLATLPSSK